MKKFVSKKSEIFTHMGIYSFASQLTQVISVISGILIRNFLGPFQMGIWSTLSLVLSYSKYTTLGTTKATAREIPYYMGQDNPEKAREIQNLVISFGFVVSMITGAGIFLYAVIFRETLHPYIFGGLLAVSFLVVIQRLSNLFIALIRSYKKFELASKQMVFSGAVNLILIVLLAWPFKLYGFLGAMALSLIFNIVYLGFSFKVNFEFRMGKELGGLIGFGFPIMLLGILTAILKSIDKIMILSLVGFEAMGLYSIAILASNFLNNIHNSMAVVFFPHIQEKFAKRDRAEDIKGAITKVAEGYSLMMPILIGACWIIAPLAVQLLLPDYVSGVRALQYICLGSFFAALTFPFGNLLITIKRHLVLLPITAVIIGISVYFNWLVLELGYGINGVAIATTAALFINFCIFYLVSARVYFNFSAGLQFYIKLMSRFLMLGIILFALEKWVLVGQGWAGTSIKLLMFIASMIPFLLSLNRKFEILSRLTKRQAK